MAAAPHYEFYLSRRYRWAVSLAVGIFFFAFLLVFLPFGVNNYNPQHEYTGQFLWVMTQFMLLTTALALALELWLKPRLLKRAGKSQVLAWSAMLMVLIGLANFLLYNWMGNWHDFRLVSALVFVGNCATILVFPLVGTFFYFRYHTLNRRLWQLHLKWEATPDRLIHFEGQGSSERLSIAASDFRYAQAQDNYVALYYLRAGTLKRELLRATLAEILEQAGPVELMRCHRSFVVNLRQVRSFSGGNPMELYLDQVATPIRVSRSYRTTVLQRLQAPNPGT